MAPSSSLLLRVTVVTDEVGFWVCGPFVLGVGQIMTLFLPTVFYRRDGVAVGSILDLLTVAFRFSVASSLSPPCLSCVLLPVSGSPAFFFLMGFWGKPFLHTLLATSLLESSSSLDPCARIHALSAASGV